VCGHMLGERFVQSAAFMPYSNVPVSGTREKFSRLAFLVGHQER
jgi:hypothetical protein